MPVKEHTSLCGLQQDRAEWERFILLAQNTLYSTSLFCLFDTHLWVSVCCTDNVVLSIKQIKALETCWELVFTNQPIKVGHFGLFLFPSLFPYFLSFPSLCLIKKDFEGILQIPDKLTDFDLLLWGEGDKCRRQESERERGAWGRRCAPDFNKTSFSPQLPPQESLKGQECKSLLAQTRSVERGKERGERGWEVWCRGMYWILWQVIRKILATGKSLPFMLFYVFTPQTKCVMSSLVLFVFLSFSPWVKLPLAVARVIFKFQSLWLFVTV